MNLAFEDKSNGIHRSFSHIWAPIWSLSFISSSVILLSYSEDDSPHPLRRFSQQWRLNHQGTEVQSPYNYHGTALWFPMPTTFYDQFAFLETQRNWEHTSWLWIVFSHVPSPKTNYRRKSRVAPFANKSYNNKSHSAVPLTRPTWRHLLGAPRLTQLDHPNTLVLEDTFSNFVTNKPNICGNIRRTKQAKQITKWTLLGI